jgi:hypothetical protein
LIVAAAVVACGLLYEQLWPCPQFLHILFQETVVVNYLQILFASLEPSIHCITILRFAHTKYLLQTANAKVQLCARALLQTFAAAVTISLRNYTREKTR